MEVEKNMQKEIPQLIEVEPVQDGYRWIAITAMLLAIGIILHTVSPNVGGVTPNWTIAMYSIVICLVNPRLSQALGIGLVAGLTLVPSSKSAFPLGNLASELAGATTACILVKAMLSMGLENWRFRPYVVGFVATMVSGSVFTQIICFILKLPQAVWLKAMLPVVLAVAVVNGLVTYLMFGPVKRLYYMMDGKDGKQE